MFRRWSRSLAFAAGLALAGCVGPAEDEAAEERAQVHPNDTPPEAQPTPPPTPPPHQVPPSEEDEAEQPWLEEDA